MEPKQQPPYPLRMPQDMRSHLEDEAAIERRSLNAHIVAALQERQDLLNRLESVENELSRAKVAMRQLGGGVQLTPTIHAIVESVSKEKGIPFADALNMLVLAGFDPTAPAVVYFSAPPGNTIAEYMEVFNMVGRSLSPNTRIFIEHGGIRDGA